MTRRIVTEEHIAAARLRLILDRRAGRDSGDLVRRIADMQPDSASEPGPGSDQPPGVESGNARAFEVDPDLLERVLSGLSALGVDVVGEVAETPGEQRAKAEVAGVGPRGLMVDLDFLEQVRRRLSALETSLAGLAQEARRLDTDSELGGGYATRVSEHNRAAGRRAVQLIEDIGRAIGQIRSMVEASRDAYRHSEETAKSWLRDSESR